MKLKLRPLSLKTLEGILAQQTSTCGIKTSLLFSWSFSIFARGHQLKPRAEYRDANEPQDPT